MRGSLTLRLEQELAHSRLNLFCLHVKVARGVLEVIADTQVPGRRVTAPLTGSRSLNNHDVARWRSVHNLKGVNVDFNSKSTARCSFPGPHPQHEFSCSKRLLSRE